MKTMYKFLVVLALTLSGLTGIQEAFAREPRITLIRRGSEDGVHYNRVIEDHHRIEGSTNHLLKCVGKGTIFCGWSNPPRETDRQGNLIEIDAIVISVDRLIQEGQLTGKMVWKTTSVFVTWSVVDKEITIDIYPRGM